MAKAVKKKGKNRRLKRSVRKTLGAMFLASALAVAAIPTEGLQAADGDDTADTPVVTVDRPHTGGLGSTDPMKVSIAPKGTTLPTGSAWSVTSIPKVDATGFVDNIYSSENLNLMFVISKAKLSDFIGDQNAQAVIVGYHDQMQMNNVGDVLTIPRTVDAYTSFMGQSCAIGGNSGELLFYKQKVGEDATVTDGDGKPMPIYEYRPCFFKQKDQWIKQEYDSVSNPTETLYYVKGLKGYTAGQFTDAGVPVGIDEDDWVAANSDTNQRIKEIPVVYIANQYAEIGSTNLSQLKDVTADHGIFTGASVASVTIEPNLEGIGNYAFAGTKINTVALSATIREIGNSAFRECPELSAFSIDPKASQVAIGDHAFSHCPALTTFDASNVQKIGDSAFESCGKLYNIKLLSNGNTGALKNLGYYAFAGCTALEEVVFPDTYAEKIPISTFMRCIGLQHIHATGNFPNMDFADDTYYSFEQFRQECNANLYFEGAQNCDLRNTVVDRYFAYKYINNDSKDVFVKKVPDESSKDSNGNYRTATFEVTRREGESNVGDVTRVQIDSGLENLKIPGVVGPLSITAIGENGFADTCNLRGVVIPPTITSIGANAFRGCHNLKSVIFEDASKIDKANIGENAFLTQEVGTGHVHTSTSTLDHEPMLSFTGAVQSGVGPFEYAMDKDVFINNGTQSDTHITYYSGWPSNLTVENVNGTATLTNYPTIKQLMEAKDRTFTADNYPYFTMDRNYEVAAYVAFYKLLGLKDEERERLKQYVENYNKRWEDFAYDLQLDAGPNKYEQQIIDNTLSVTLPEGIVAIKDGLFKEKEADGDYLWLRTYGYLPTDSVTDGNAASSGGLTSTNGEDLGKTFTVNLKDLADQSFAGCKMLDTIIIGAGTETIGDYAFQDCSYLEDVFIDQKLNKMGLVPFIGCNNLADIRFNNNPNFYCEESVLFGPASDGTASRVIEYLNGADYQMPDPKVLSNATEIAEEAFRDTNIRQADFSGSTVKIVPRSAFENTGKLGTVILPHTAIEIQEKAFKDSAIEYLRGIPSALTMIASDAFSGVPSGDANYCTFFAPVGSFAQRFAESTSNPNLKFIEADEIAYYTINFYYEDENGEKVVVHTVENVPTGETVDVDRLLKEGAFDDLPKEINGQVFKRSWLPVSSYTKVSGSANPLEARAVYGAADKHTVTFLDKDNIVIWSGEVLVGGTINYIPAAPPVAGYTFSAWESLSPGLPGTYSLEDLDTVAEDMTFRAVYLPTGGTTSGNGSGTGGDGSGGSGSGGNGSGGNGSGGSGSGGNGSGGNGSGTTSGNGSGDYYTLTVINGHGSGSYVVGQQAIISANDPANGMEFSNWTIDPAGTKILSTGISATVVTMPAANVTVTAHYRTKTGSSNGSGSTSSASSSRRPNNTGTITSGGTTVVIDKNGISNTGVVAATVNGSSDNFVIKITESSSASEAAVRALMAEYGNLDNIKYFPMDISLYDSTGNNKITDTTGLSVSITLPLPDSLITYAGNNRVAGVVNDRLDKLTPKFTTISGVSCITFTAEHFSPYVIYVDTANLSAGGNADSTPKTGDGIHPKWFLSIGLACLSFVMFMQKDRKKPQKVKVRAKTKG
ncbi:MAG: leucine-rich repeat protein [Lachnospiraceae bacterium]|nr:leucine-rich repeat protein [Butyrivibrio sp.]MCM1344339.1 leucine-rich repeat protein [Muribaculaceae bacterium]MCM1411998.1 leucine-rich repeat protein [Lachnospiraceae bacterium]